MARSLWYASSLGLVFLVAAAGAELSRHHGEWAGGGLEAPAVCRAVDHHPNLEVWRQNILFDEAP
jgi:hypothetical protein